MIKTAIVGLGKMGLSHLAIARTHPSAQLVAGCDASKFLTSGLTKYTSLKCYNEYDRLLDEEDLDAVIIATPSRLHESMISKALDRDLHVFCEKPFVLDPTTGAELADRAESKALVNQVGYHYRFVGAFQKAAQIVASGAIGQVHHVRAEAYGPVVLREKGSTWRSAKSEGGGALYDYACHAIDLLNFVYTPPTSVGGVVRNRIFSKDVDDEVYCTMQFGQDCSGQLSVNWSDESHRKMSTKISVWGSNGRVVADRQECQVFLRSSHPSMPDCGEGWTIFYTTDLTKDPWFYLRGEEYSAQIDHFMESIRLNRMDGENTFRSAVATDNIVRDLLTDSTEFTDSSVRIDNSHNEATPAKRGRWSKIFSS